tara:strand:- start:425 stop:892 length:468 start_codon:yes stop_codon:yes gene_type:complete
MVDLTQFNGGEAFDIANANGSGGSSLEPGRYILHYAGSDIIEGKNNWKALKMLFEVDGTTINVSNTFTMGSDNPKAIDIGQNSLMLLMNAMGVNSMKNADELIGKSVCAELIRADSGYLEIKEDFGRTWQVVGAAKSEPKEEPKSDSSVEDSIPF